MGALGMNKIDRGGARDQIFSTNRLTKRSLGNDISKQQIQSKNFLASLGNARRHGEAEKQEESASKFTTKSVANCLAHMREHTETEKDVVVGNSGVNLN